MLLSFLLYKLGGFYQDQMGQIVCKRCSLGTYVSKELHPGTSAAACEACPYGKNRHGHPLPGRFHCSSTSYLLKLPSISPPSSFLNPGFQISKISEIYWSLQILSFGISPVFLSFFLSFSLSFSTHQIEITLSALRKIKNEDKSQIGINKQHLQGGFISSRFISTQEFFFFRFKKKQFSKGKYNVNMRMMRMNLLSLLAQKIPN